MRRQATGAFDIVAWDQEPLDDAPGATLSRARVTKTFRGDLVGSSVTHLVLANATEQSAAYGGFERFEGSLHDRWGTFVLHHDATLSPEGRTLRWSVVPDSGTGELAGLRGEGSIDVDASGGHTYALDVELR